MKFSQKIILFLLRGVIVLLRLLPARAMLAICSRLTGLSSSFLINREYRIAKAQIELAQIADKKSSDRLARKVFENAGEGFGETLLIGKICQNQKTYIEPIGQDFIEHLISEKRGAIALSAHLGCFELLAAYQKSCGLQLAVVGRDSNYQALSVLIRELRGQYGALALWRDDPSLVRKMMKMLKEGGTVATLIDQDVDLENTFSPFFKIPAAWPSGPIRLAMRLNAAIFSCFVVRTERLRYRVISEEIKYSPENPEAATEVLAEYIKRLEKMIREYPEQWMWWHRRWRRRPEIDYKINPQALRSTEQYIEWLKQEAQAKEAAN